MQLMPEPLGLAKATTVIKAGHWAVKLKQDPTSVMSPEVTNTPSTNTKAVASWLGQRLENSVVTQNWVAKDEHSGPNWYWITEGLLLAPTHSLATGVALQQLAAVKDWAVALY